MTVVVYVFNTARMNTEPYTHFLDRTDGSGQHTGYVTEESARKAHQAAIEDKRTLRSRIIFYHSAETGRMIVEWVRGWEK